MLPASQIPDLLEADGRFTSRVVAIGTRIYFDRKVQAQVRAELRAQFEAYAATGLALRSRRFASSLPSASNGLRDAAGSG